MHLTFVKLIADAIEIVVENLVKVYFADFFEFLEQFFGLFLPLVELCHDF